LKRGRHNPDNIRAVIWFGRSQEGHIYVLISITYEEKF
jgi:hypothetical protein